MMNPSIRPITSLMDLLSYAPSKTNVFHTLQKLTLLVGE